MLFFTRGRRDVNQMTLPFPDTGLESCQSEAKHSTYHEAPHNVASLPADGEETCCIITLIMLKTLKYFCINHVDRRSFQFKIIINASANSFRFI